MGRPKKSPNELRDVQTTVLYTAEERAELELRAKALGLTLSGYIRNRTLGIPLPPNAADRAVKDKLATALIRIGNNLNQMTKRINSGRPTPHDLPQLLDTLRAHLDRLHDEPRRDRTG